MTIIEYIKDKLLFISINFIMFIITAVLLVLVDVSPVVIFLIFCIWFFPIISYMLNEFLKQKRYYDEIEEMLNNLEKKYMIAEIMKEPNFIEGKITYNILKTISRNMHEEVKYYRILQEEYREYIETWVHEIKTPIASAKLILDNNKNDVLNSKINKQLNRIEDFVEQALYYSKSNDVSNDYIIKEFNLKNAVNSVIRRNSSDFINKKIKLEIEDIDDKKIFSDIKWVEFIINQIVVNSIKYSKSDNNKVKIKAYSKQNATVLEIEDNGVGIEENDVNRVFDKGFTGENGRRFTKATGMGLYLSKKLCKKLGLGIKLESEKDKGTKVSIIFPINQHINMK